MEKNTFTEKEIYRQPGLWLTVFEILVEQKMSIQQFLEPIIKKEDLRIILTGAGSSSFIGEAAQGVIQKKVGRVVQAISTTDIVTHADLFLSLEVPTLLVSFARSGDSPESLEVFYLAEKLCKEVYHLIITCNKEGKLITDTSVVGESCYKLILPEEANDESLAMTGSFTSMLLCALIVWDMKNIESNRKSVEGIISIGYVILKQSNLLKTVIKKKIERVVFLGSGPMTGIARECQLKLQELTNGKIICKHDSFLGFRHGPRVIVNKNTLIVFLFSADKHVCLYERDLARSISNDPGVISVFFNSPEDLNLVSGISIGDGMVDGNNMQIIPATLIGQLLGLYKSLQLGLNPDNPSINGAINRVVQGVTIYRK